MMLKQKTNILINRRKHFIQNFLGKITGDDLFLESVILCHRKGMGC